MRAARAALQGLFAVYKPPGVPWTLVRGAVETQLLRDLNLLERPAARQHVRFLPGTVEGKDGKELTMTVTQVPVLADHPLVSGPVFTHLKIGAGHRLDTKSSGVFLLGAGYGNKLLTDWYNAHLTRAYTVRGLFGKATDDFSDTGTLIEKTTFDHITREHLERILSVIQGSNQKALLQPPPSPCFLPPRRYRPPKEREDANGSKEPLSFSKSPAHPRQWNVGRSMGSDHHQPLWKVALISLSGIAFLLWCVLRPETDLDRYANLDLKTQEAYEMAVKGLIRPMEKSPPLITAVRCLQFAPPEFQLEIHCLHETQQYLRKIVHEIGLELKSSAVCTQVRRMRDGVFVLDDALLRTQWNLPNIQSAILKSRVKVEAELRNSLAHQEPCMNNEGETEAGPGSMANDTEWSSGENVLPANSVVK